MIAGYSKAMELKTDNEEPWHLRGHLYGDLRQWDKAVNDFAVPHLAGIPRDTSTLQDSVPQLRRSGGPHNSAALPALCRREPLIWGLAPTRQKGTPLLG